MNKEANHNVYGPVPSRRLGRSLGVNNIPWKTCSYSCIYCQLGKAIKMQVERQSFYDPEDLFRQAASLLEATEEDDKFPDYITIVPDGEPTLDLQLGFLIDRLKTLGIPLAVITNSSLIDRQDVREDLYRADYVSVKTDAIDPEIWRRINKPVRGLQLERLLKALDAFSRSFNGILTTETMLISGMNDHTDELKALAEFIYSFDPDRSYLAIPTRPPAWKSAIPSSEARLNEAFHLFTSQGLQVELLTGYEGNAFASSGDSKQDILSITAVHPMREDAIREMIAKTNDDWSLVNKMLAQSLIEEVEYKGRRYYLRKFHE